MHIYHFIDCAMDALKYRYVFVKRTPPMPTVDGCRTLTVSTQLESIPAHFYSVGYDMSFDKADKRLAKNNLVPRIILPDKTRFTQVLLSKRVETQLSHCSTEDVAIQQGDIAIRQCVQAHGTMTEWPTTTLSAESCLAVYGNGFTLL